MMIYADSEENALGMRWGILVSRETGTSLYIDPISMILPTLGLRV